MRPDTAKPTKVPYIAEPNGGKCDVTKLEHLRSFEAAIAAPIATFEAVPWDYTNNRPLYTIAQTGFSGIGFAFVIGGKYTGIDLDDTHGDSEAYTRQVKIFEAFDSYSELSPSGNGLHIIIKATLPNGRRRAGIEIYPHSRFFTMTGNVFNNKPIEERQILAMELFDQMGGAVTIHKTGVDKEQTETDETILERAALAVNGPKFNKLYSGDWQSLYSSQSEADFALVDILAFYTQNRVQIRRMFRASALGQRDKAQRDDYVAYMVEKSFDRQLPPVDVEGLRLAYLAKLAGPMGAAAGEPGGNPAAAGGIALAPEGNANGAVEAVSHEPDEASSLFPPGLVGEVAQYLFDAAPRPVAEIALAGAIGLIAGICGRSYNISGQGLNQYILMLAKTGAGKDAIASGLGKLMNAVCASVPAAKDFDGPGELVSSAGVIKWLDKKPAILCIIGEIAVKLKEMTNPNANAHLAGLERFLLQVYSKSAAGNKLDPMAYSDAQKNTSTIQSPSLTLIGESVPERFYAMLDDTMIASGLLPRFMIFEYKGKRVYLKENTESVLPSLGLVQRLADLASQSLSLSAKLTCHNIRLDNSAAARFREFEVWTTDEINRVDNPTIAELWNRAHLKALKLAGVLAIGINFVDPVVTLAIADYAINLIVNQTQKLVYKFVEGEVGDLGGSEANQIAEVIKTIATRIHSDHERFAKYGDSAEMHRDGVVTYSHISRRLVAMAAFRLDRFGATNAIKRVIQNLLDSEELKEVPKMQMQMKYGTGPRAFVVANPTRFVKAAQDANKPA